VSEDSEWISLPENLNESEIKINPMLWHGAFIGADVRSRSYE
jgi:hypothetical protein